MSGFPLKATWVALAPRELPIDARFYAKAASAGWFGSSVDRSAEGDRSSELGRAKQSFRRDNDCTIARPLALQSVAGLACQARFYSPGFALSPASTGKRVQTAACAGRGGAGDRQANEQ